VLDNCVLKKIFGPKRVEVTGGSGEDYIMSIFMMYPSHHILFRLSNQEEEECGACGIYGERRSA
jgi:hypothetical protein